MKGPGKVDQIWLRVGVYVASYKSYRDKAELKKS
jgi:hypothetical protein